MKKLADISNFEALGGVQNVKSDISVFNLQVPQQAKDAIVVLGDVSKGLSDLESDVMTGGVGEDDLYIYEEGYNTDADVVNRRVFAYKDAIEALVQGYAVPENSILEPEEYLNRAILACEENAVKVCGIDVTDISQDTDIIYQEALAQLENWNNIG